MFGKLLKHEFRATGRFALPLCGLMLALAVLAGLAMRSRNDMSRMIDSAIIVLYGMSLFVAGAGIFIILMQRFKQNLFGSEGYLTRTLPVSEHGLLLSKLLTAVCWYVVSGALIALSVLIAGALSGGISWRELGGAMDAAWRHLPRIGAGAAYAAFGALGGMIFITLLFYAVSTISQNFRKRKLLYYVMIFVIAVALLRLLSIINNALTGTLMGMASARNGVGIIGGADGPTSIHVTSDSALALVELYVSDVVLYFVTWAFLKYRPNLE